MGHEFQQQVERLRMEEQRVRENEERKSKEMVEMPQQQEEKVRDFQSPPVTALTYKVHGSHWRGG